MSSPRHPETIATWANVVTALRTVGGTVLFAMATARQSARWNLAGLLVYWSLDALDGYLARRLNQETRLGAQFDILSDRLLVTFFYMNYLSWHHELVWPIALFLLQFMLLDHYLSNQFLRWNIVSPNDFHRVDITIWRLNWSTPAKLTNTGLATGLMLVQAPYSAIAASLIVTGVKLYSLTRLWRLRCPELAWRPMPPRPTR
jgi:CDP-diacylglycerol--glycerol-3-phosphate 3-phosphatidyltransferase